MSSDSEHKIFADDPRLWLEQANASKLSAEVMRDALLAVIAEQRPPDETRLRKLAYMGAFMMLLGIAFENVLKGLLVAKKAGRWEEYQHHLARMAKVVTRCSAAEIDLLMRLEIFVVWAGRYMIAKTPERHDREKDSRKLSSADWHRASDLFDRLARELEAAAGR